MAKTRNILIGLAVVATVAAGLAVSWLRGRRRPPSMHVLLITLDTTRADRLGCYGYDQPTTPNLDQLADDAVLFDMAIAQAAVTPVSHASILTGLNPHHHGLRVMHGLAANTLDEKHTTLAEVWQAAGGRTAAFVSAFPVTPTFGLGQGFEHFDMDFPNADGEGLVSEAEGWVSTGSSQRRADATTTAAITWLESQPEAETPLLMWVHYFDPHDPFVLPPKEMLGQFPPRSKDRADVLRAIYDGEVAYMDAQIGRLFDAFKQRGLWDRTIVVVVADHGEGLGDHDWWTHGILYQEQIHVPQIVRVPGIRPRRVMQLVRTIDLMPTVLELADVPDALRPVMDGEGLTYLMRTGWTGKPRVAYSDSVNMLGYGRFDDSIRRDDKYEKLYCLIDGSYKLIFHQLQPENTEFYDLLTDPREQTNLAASKPPAMLAMMEQLKTMQCLSPIMPGMTPTDLNRLGQLESLGYIDRPLRHDDHEHRSDNSAFYNQ